MSLFNNLGQVSSSQNTSLFPQNPQLQVQQAPVQKDMEIIGQPSQPDDTVSALSFSPSPPPNTMLLGVVGWDSMLRLTEIQSNGATVPKGAISHGNNVPILGMAWVDDGTKVFTAGCDKQVKCFDIPTGQAFTVAQHDAPVRTVHWVKTPSANLLLTTSWDKTMKLWDIRTAPNTTPLTIPLPERSYCADVKYPLAVVSTAQRFIQVFDIDMLLRVVSTPGANSAAFTRNIESPLKYQHRCVAIFNEKKQVPGGPPVISPNPNGFAVGSIEGRVAIQYMNPANPKDNFTFKCHRSEPTDGNQDVYSVHAIVFHPVHQTLATVGGDGKYCFWDKDARSKLRTSDQSYEAPITAATIDPTGTIFAFATGYDWCKGHEAYDPNRKPRLLFRLCSAEMSPTQQKK